MDVAFQLPDRLLLLRDRFLHEVSDREHADQPLAIGVQHHRLTPPQELRELLHDADEGLINFDCISPLKPFLGPGFADLQARLSGVIAMRYRLPAWSAEEKRAHKAVDVAVAAAEAVHVVGWTAQEVRETLAETFRQGVYGEADDAFVEGMVDPWTSEEGVVSLSRAAIATNTSHTTEIDPSGIDAETLLLWGAEDEFQPIEYAERLAEDVDDSELVALEDAQDHR